MIVIGSFVKLFFSKIFVTFYTIIAILTRFKRFRNPVTIFICLIHPLRRPYLPFLLPFINYPFCYNNTYIFIVIINSIFIINIVTICININEIIEFYL